MTAPRRRTRERYDAAIVGGGHNGLVAATMLARAGRSVIVLERSEHVGGAAISGAPWPGVGVRLSRYAYLVSLFPAALLRSLGVGVRMHTRAVASYTPHGDGGLLITTDGGASRASMERLTGDPRAFDAWEAFYAGLTRLAERLFGTMLEPLHSRSTARRLAGDDALWDAIIETPLADVLERTFASDVVRGVVLTDATIGTFAPADDLRLRQNRCFLYHVIGNGTGRWDVPEGGMGSVSEALRDAALAAGAEIRTSAEVVAIAADGRSAEIECAGGSPIAVRDVLAGVAPAVLARLLGTATAEPPEGAQLKINMLLRRLPRLRDVNVAPEQAFAGTFHVNEGYLQLQRAYEQAAAGELPSLPPCEVYCHSLTDPSILSAELRDGGAQTLTLFGLHMPARLFSGADAERVKAAAVKATLASLDSVLAEPIADCLMSGPDGEPCLEALTPPELEHQLGMPGGHIFHRDLSWPFAEDEADVGRWGVETGIPNVWICGAGARRGGGVSGIPGHNAARALLEVRG